MALKRRSLSIEDKLKILSEIDKSPKVKMSAIAKNYKLSSSTLSTIVTNRKAIEDYAKEGYGKLTYRRKRRCSPFSKVELVLMAWIRQCTASNIPLNGCLIKEKGLLIARKLGVPSFSASTGWLKRFKNRFSLDYSSEKNAHPTSEEACSSTEWTKSHLLPLIEKYDACDIYNADETGLFYNPLIDGSYCDFEEFKGNDDRKDRLTVLLCANADGSSKLPPLIVGKCDRPRDFEDFKSFPCKYVKNSKGWITASIFEEYLHFIDCQMKALNRKILLFVDHCAAHSPNTLSENVKVVFFPSGCSNEVQPFSVGVMNVFKQNYRRIFEHNSESLKTRHGPSSLNVELLDALQFVISSWDEISTEVIKYCFFKVGFPMGNVNESVLTCMEKFNDMETIDFNNRISTCGLQTLDELCEELQANDAYSDSDERVFPDVGVSFEESQETNNIEIECEATERNYSNSTVTSYENHHEDIGSLILGDVKLNGRDSGETDDSIERDIPNFEAALGGFRTYKKYVSSFNIDEDLKNMLLMMEIALYKLHTRENLRRKTGNNADEVS